MVTPKISIFLLIVVVSCIQALPAQVSDESLFKDVALPLVNAKRKLHHNTPNLVWNSEIEADAQSCADSASATKSFTNCFNVNHHYGKIIYTLSGYSPDFPSDFLIDYIVEKIYESGAGYEYGTKTANSFSQLIWKSSSQLGVGLSMSEGSKGIYNYYIIFYFSPAGNVGDATAFKANVQPPFSIATQAPPVIITTETAAPPPAGGLNNIQALCLSEHNGLRALHIGTPDMIYDFEIEKSAQHWADHLADIQGFKHEDPTPYGENIHKGYTTYSVPISDDNAIKKAVTKWYSEINVYDYSNPGYSDKTGHFTQVIWKSSTKLGCAISRYEKDNKKYVIVVARYYSPGNFPGRFSTNVLPL